MSNPVIQVKRTATEGFTNEHGVYYPSRLQYRYSVLGKAGYVETDNFAAVDNSNGCINPNFDNFSHGTFRACRKCSECLRRRRWKWYFKALRELDTWERTWFVTLTFATIPEHPFEEVQKWLKRLRKSHPSKIKYLCTTEYGSENGRLHYHLLVHCEESLKRRDVESKWNSGFSTAKLVQKPVVYDAVTKRRKHNKAISYVTKYLLKSNQKLRSSQHYGKGHDNIPF